MSIWSTTSTNSRFGSTGVGPAIEGSFSTAWRSKQSPSIPSRTSPWSNVPREQGLRPQQVVVKAGNLSEVNNHLSKMCLSRFPLAANGRARSARRPGRSWIKGQPDHPARRQKAPLPEYSPQAFDYRLPPSLS
jgi:hypothetical protein